MKSLSKTEIISIGFMMFSIFFGAGNLIFPPALGQAAGNDFVVAILGFLITGVGLPLLGIVAIALSGGNYTCFIADHIHPSFAVGLLSVLYLTIGPLFAIPRTGAVSFEIGIHPFLSDANLSLGQFIYTALFFVLTYVLALNPSKLVARVGKILTPILLVFLVVLFVQAFSQPLGGFMEPTGKYVTNPLLQGFQDGYLTMDLLASIAIGTIVVNAIRAEGVTDKRAIGRVCIFAGGISVLLMSMVYVSLSYLGATSRSVLGLSDNGGIILSQAANIFFGTGGNILLALIIGFACITTSCGMASSCAWFFNNITKGRISYQRVLFLSVLFSFVVSNIGLTGLIRISVPFLIAIYPVFIVLVVLSLIDSIVGGSKSMYRWSIGLTLAFSIFDGLNASGLQVVAVNNFFNHYIPLYSVNLGWMVPAVLGIGIGYAIPLIRSEKHETI
ncbi:MAG: branched-chain amino acid transport system II carrier protein [Selenomonadaceae bacterium]